MCCGSVLYGLVQILFYFQLIFDVVMYDNNSEVMKYKQNLRKTRPRRISSLVSVFVEEI